MIFTRRPKKKYKVGLALSGGGARGFAHLGVIQALSDCGITPDVVAGVSAGSVVTAFYGAGLTTDQVLAIFKGAPFKKFAEMQIPRRGMFSLHRFADIIEKECGISRIEELKVPSVICATNFDTGQPEAFTSGRLGVRVAASCAIPIIFEPVKIGRYQYVDGGVLHNLPAWAIREQCETLIGVNCSSMDSVVQGPAEGIFDIASRALSMMTKGNIYPDLDRCDLAIELAEVSEHQTFDLNNIEFLVEQGYLIAMRAIRQSGFQL